MSNQTAKIVSFHRDGFTPLPDDFEIPAFLRRPAPPREVTPPWAGWVLLWRLVVHTTCLYVMCAFVASPFVVLQ